MLDQCHADVSTGTKQHGKHTFRRARFAGRLLDEQTDGFRSAEVPLMRFNNDGTTRGQSRGGVAARDGKRKWKIARTEDRDRPEWLKHRAHVWLGNRLAFGIGVIDASVEPPTFFD